MYNIILHLLILCLIKVFITSMKVRIVVMNKSHIESLSIFSTHCNLYYNKTKLMSIPLQQLLSVVGNRYGKEVRCILTNTVRMMKNGAKSVKIPRTRGHYSYNEQGISYERMMAVLDLLEQQGYLNLYIGGLVGYDYGEPTLESSITEPTEKLFNLFSTIDIYKIDTPEGVEVVEIKDRLTGKLKSTKGFNGVNMLRDSAEEYNTAMSTAQIKYKDELLPTMIHKRAYVDNLTRGGRWYNVVGGVQTMQSDLRKYLTIDDEPVTDLDFSAMHLSILYEWIVQDTPELLRELGQDFDPYDLNTDMFLPMDLQEVGKFCKKYNKPDYKPWRNLVKMATLIALNSSSKREAIVALSTDFGKDKKKRGTADEVNCDYYGITGEFMPRYLFSELVVHNKYIEKYFYSDIGIDLQQVEGCIMAYVIEKTLADGEILLPFHDGVLVKKSVADKVIHHMKEAWAREIGSFNFCKVTRKDL